MKVIDDFGGAHELAPVRAILIYEEKVNSGESNRVATVHNISHRRGSAFIMPGAALTTEAIHDLILTMNGVRAEESDFIPDNVICSNPTRLIWWKESHVNQIFFKTDTEGDKCNELSGKTVTHPNLLFCAEKWGLKVFALAEAKRPTLETELYDSPYYNVSEDGLMCRGNSNMPKGILIPYIKGFEQSFFDTNFTHTNRGGVVKHPEHHYGYWRDMVGEELKPVPVQYFNKSKFTVADLIKSRV